MSTAGSGGCIACPSHDLVCRVCMHLNTPFFQHPPTCCRDQMDLVFQDADLVPLLVQENYINHRPKIAQNDTMRMQVGGCVCV